ncbi:MAG: SRPBCC family protein [Micropepsaceae bacterium]
MAASTESDTSNREIVTTRTYDAPRDLVWAAFTSAEHLSHWWGPDGFRITTLAMDFRQGGSWHFIMHGPDGTDFPNFIRYTAIDPLERIAFNHGVEPDAPPHFTNTITFENDGPRTRVIMRATFPTAEARDHVVREFKAIEGGQQTLARLTEHLKQTAILQVSRNFNFQPEVVFDAWLNADSARNWWFKTPTGQMVSCEIEPRVDGKFRIVERRGDTEAGHFGRFLELKRPNRIVFEFATDREQAPTRVTIEIRPTPSGCELTLWHVMDPQWAIFLERARGGWTMILESLNTTLGR